MWASHPKASPHSSKGRLLVKMVDRFSYRRMVAEEMQVVA